LAHARAGPQPRLAPTWPGLHHFVPLRPGVLEGDQRLLIDDVLYATTSCLPSCLF
jgi:hypothetical protein